MFCLSQSGIKKISNKRRGKTRIYTDTSARDKVEKRQAQKRSKKSADCRKSTKRKLFSKKASLVISSPYTDEENMELTNDDGSDCELEEKI